MRKIPTHITYGWLFILTGVFAFVSGFYTWGEGVIYRQNDLLKVLIPWTDLLLTAPISIASGLGLIKNNGWGFVLAGVTSGIYILGSFLVFIVLFWTNSFPTAFVIPAAFGFMLAVSFIAYRLSILDLD